MSKVHQFNPDDFRFDKNKLKNKHVSLSSFRIDINKLNNALGSINKSKANKISKKFDITVDKQKDVQISPEASIAANKSAMTKKIAIAVMAYEESVNEYTKAYNDLANDKNSSDTEVVQLKLAVQSAQSNLEYIQKAETYTNKSLAKAVKMANGLRTSGINIPAHAVNNEISKELIATKSKLIEDKANKSYIQLGASVFLLVSTYSIAYGIIKSISALDNPKSILDIVNNIKIMIKGSGLGGPNKVKAMVLSLLLYVMLASLIASIGMLFFAVKYMIANKKRISNE